MDVLADLDRFYGLIDRVRDQHGGDQRLSTCDARSGWPDEIRRSWGTGQSAPPEVRAVEYPLERAVAEYIGRMPLLWVGVSDEPSASSERGVIERGAIALLSASARLGIDPPSQEWLGNRADRAVIRQSGLWNVDHVGETHEPRTLAVLDHWIG